MHAVSIMPKRSPNAKLKPEAIGSVYIGGKKETEFCENVVVLPIKIHKFSALIHYYRSTDYLKAIELESLE